MKKLLRYFDDLFKKFDIWLFFVAIFLIILAFYRRNLDEISTMSKYLLVAIPLLVVVGNIGNLKKQANILDVFSIVFLFIYIYFAIRDPQVFSILVPCLLMVEVILRIAFYSCEDEIEQNASKLFFAHLNYRFPLLVLVILGFSFAFGGYYIATSKAEWLPYFTNILMVCSTLVPVLYWILVYAVDSKKINFLDYIYFVLCCVIVGSILLYYPKELPIFTIFTMIIPYLALCIRAHSYTGELELKKKKYVSCFLLKYHTIAPFIIGFGAAYIVAFTSNHALFDLHQNIYLAVLAGISVVLCILLLVMKHLKATVIKPIDYVLFLLASILFFLLIYVVCVALDLYGTDYKKEFFSDMITLISLFVSLVCLLVLIILYSIRYRYFFNVASVEPQEEVVAEPEVVEESPIKEEMPKEEETPVVEESKPVKEETPAEEPVVEESEPVVEETEPVVEEELEEPEVEEESEAEEEDEEQEETEPEAQKAADEATTLQSGELKIVIPNDESQNHLTKVKYLGKLMFSDSKLKKLYSEVKNHLLSYGTTSRIASNKETFKKKGTLAIVRLAGKSLNVYLAILPEPFLESDYRIKNVQNIKQYEETPTMIKVKTKRSLKEFKEIVDVMMIHRDIKPKAHYKKVDFEQVLIPDGEAILNSLGYSSDNLVSSISAKIIPADMPADLERFVPILQQAPLASNVSYTPVYLDTLCNYYEQDEIVTKESLVEKNLIKSSAAIIVKSRGTLDKRLTIYADAFESDALKMIYITNGKAVLISHSDSEE